MSALISTSKGQNMAPVYKVAVIQMHSEVGYHLDFP